MEEVRNRQINLVNRNPQQTLVEVDQRAVARAEIDRQPAAFHPGEVSRRNHIRRIAGAVDLDGDVGGGERQHIGEPDPRRRVRVRFQRKVSGWIRDAGLAQQRHADRDVADRDTVDAIASGLIRIRDLRVRPIRTAHTGEEIRVGETNRRDVEFANRLVLEDLGHRFALLEGKGATHIDKLRNLQHGVVSTHAEQRVIVIERDRIAAGQHAQPAIRHR